MKVERPPVVTLSGAVSCGPWDVSASDKGELSPLVETGNPTTVGCFLNRAESADLGLLHRPCFALLSGWV